MSKARAQAAPQREAGAGVPKDPIQLKPRKALFIALMIALAIWVAILVVLYLTTVRGKQPRPGPVKAATSPQSSLPADRRWLRPR